MRVLEEVFEVLPCGVGVQDGFCIVSGKGVVGVPGEWSEVLLC